MIKRVDVATYNASKSVVENTFKAGHQSLGIKEGGIGMAETTTNNTPEDVIKVAKEWETKFSKGEAKAPATRQEAKDFK